ncbi:hypothetical protein [Legionella genomosp. 1]|uniref:hypothetical protein n=1 Tax=Legionella genomosp. 1 TaxID=1093625 RepID=UPI0010541CF6|nr:hypothetical protein [Legionella genomosp. 1]
MKIMEVYVRKDWINTNTSRRRYRQSDFQDSFSMLTKSAKAVPAFLLAGAGMSRNLPNQSMSLSNYAMHTLKEVHNGIGNVGKNKDCRFNTLVEVSGQNELRKAVDLHGALPYSRVYIVTDDDVTEDELDRGVVFHSKTEAIKFSEMYKDLDDYRQSSLYKEPVGISVTINKKDMGIFLKEMTNFIDKRNRSWRADVTVIPEINVDSFDLSSDDDNYIIDFPVDITKKEFKKYFKGTFQASTQSEPGLSSLNMAGGRRGKWGRFSEEEKEKESYDSKESSSEEELVLKRKHPRSEPSATTTTTTTSVQVPASGLLAKSMNKGVFQSAGEKIVGPESSDEVSAELHNKGATPSQ